ncbi:twin-arginine translocation signal domain-containing protein [Halorussus lipolyticus]|uniref:twin-arginine translocation signal domain-containing protein n=1 Tax=Halorussus lipolyticus TaxID=3034024 RepID=UPI0023E8D375|nr:twin-arginine translocation signal domain-containing protein [Halorussus sp. DT80]
MSHEDVSRRDALKRITATASAATLGTAALSGTGAAELANEVRVEPFNADSEKDYRLIFGQADSVQWEKLESDDNWEYLDSGLALDGTIASSGDDVDVIWYDSANLVVDESQTDCCVRVTLNGDQIYP